MEAVSLFKFSCQITLACGKLTKTRNKNSKKNPQKVTVIVFCSKGLLKVKWQVLVQTAQCGVQTEFPCESLFFSAFYITMEIMNTVYIYASLFVVQQNMNPRKERVRPSP